jgi:hypothetical protein
VKCEKNLLRKRLRDLLLKDVKDVSNKFFVDESSLFKKNGIFN